MYTVLTVCELKHNIITLIISRRATLIGEHPIPTWSPTTLFST